MSVSEYYHLWQERIPDSMSPTTNDERVKFVDLIMRSMFYLGLEDTYLQQQICDHNDDDPTLKKFFDIACEAEQKRKSFQSIGTSSSQLDSSSDVSVSKINKWDDKKRSFGKSGNSDDFGGKTQEAGQQQQQ